MATLERAIQIACDAHAGQVDKAGAPYVLHPLRVMLACETPEARMAAALHDAVEDSEGRVTLETLRAEGFSDAVVAAVDALTKRAEEENDYEAFIRRLASDPLAREVKLADLRDNSDLTRIAAPTERDRERLRKYTKAIAYLERWE